MMQPKKANYQRSFLCPDLLDQLDPRNHLLRLFKVVPLRVLVAKFRPIYAASGCPAKSIRLMVGFRILKQLKNLSGVRFVEVWSQNSYFQPDFGQQRFPCRLLCGPSDLTYFRRRIGVDGVQYLGGLRSLLRCQRR